MSNGTGQHPNAPLTPEGRRRMVACVLDPVLVGGRHRRTVSG